MSAFKMVPEKTVRDFRAWLASTPSNRLPSPRSGRVLYINSAGAFDTALPRQRSKGADTVLRDIVRIAYNRGAQDATYNDDEPALASQFAQSGNYPSLVEKLEAFGLSKGQIEQACVALGSDKDQACDEDDPDVALREFLAGRLDDADIEAAVKLAAKDRFGKTAAEDEPPPFSGRPRPGGGMDPIVRNTGARDQAMAAVRRIAIDNSFGVQSFGSPAAVTPRRVLASDTSSKATASFAARWPDVARIRRV